MFDALVRSPTLSLRAKRPVLRSGSATEDGEDGRQGFAGQGILAKSISPSTHSTMAHGLRLLDPYGYLHLSKLLFGFLEFLKLVFIVPNISRIEGYGFINRLNSVLC